MIVKELKEALENAPDNAEVYIDAFSEPLTLIGHMMLNAQNCGKVEEKMDFTATMEITAKRIIKTLKRIEREGRLYYQQFVNLVKDESIYYKILRCVKYGDKVPQKYMRKYNLVVKNLKNMQRKR